MSGFTLNFEYLLSLVGLIVWAIRLEGRVNSVDKAHTETQKDVDNVRSLQGIYESKLAEQMAQVRESLARIEGFLKLRDD